MKRKKYLLEKIEVTGYAAEGKSLAKQDGKVIFIEGAVPGDIADVFVSKNKKDWAEGKATHIHHYSKERVEPFCQHFGICGGCKWQMLPYQKQLEYKQQEVAQNFRRIGKVELPEMLPIVGADSTQHYRNKLEFTFSNKRYLTEKEIKGDGILPQENALGFHVPRIFDKIIDIQECYLMDDVNNTIRNSVRDFAKENNYTYYDIRQHTGWLRNIIIRLCSTGELMVNICLGYEDEIETKKLLDHLLLKVPSITTLLYTINTKWNDSIYDLTPQVYFGKGYAAEKLEEFTFKIGPKSFFQTNTKQAEKLYTITRDFAGLTGSETVYDLYCGTGSIGIFVSKYAKKVIGVEVIAEAIEDAKENAALNNITHADFFAGDVIKICDDTFFAKHGRPDVIITDPPRAGMHEKLTAKLLEIAAPKIVYVSCNTATQARDIGLLSEKYTVEKIQPVDMFPHTHHIECVVLLTLK
ncbi:23S rRNA (uracil(1939)-C(5))-methyltransferase RlmD [Ferruginibacter lapsinanis]|uniref:23S rRNA (uracil(1939)-C(5))-methyltransferase RlmD n=1 Tax=Ferruginibacter lapsinanis TaxID=563172 RepID=UPI001E4C28C3|nr:23S rRNA (uracil(1939)-C(5))-methyltransferase RlmD [Ferruginibacter lapsinanis]UEG50838.1 23S rRNA (uracil(1939)-C(5))-methyltransferase RlmD [Ferruginibacter lapsinanis]